MRPEIKFCGLTRPDDAALAASLGVRYVGVVLAGGPRNVSVEHAARVLDAGGTSVLRAGVFRGADDPELDNAAQVARLNVIQLHNDPTADDIARARARTQSAVWAVVRVEGTSLPATLPELFDAADAVLLDARVPGRLGGAGVALPWNALADGIAAARGRGKLVLAGGLTPENVRDAVHALAPDVVDVSSGIESSPGVKDADRMRRFVEAVAR